MNEAAQITVKILVRPEGTPGAWFSSLVRLCGEEDLHIPALHPVSGATTVTVCGKDLCDPGAMEELLLWVADDHAALCPACLKASV